jgi:hypothetical protein
MSFRNFPAGLATDSGHEILSKTDALRQSRREGQPLEVPAALPMQRIAVE